MRRRRCVLLEANKCSNGNYVVNWCSNGKCKQKGYGSTHINVKAVSLLKLNEAPYTKNIWGNGGVGPRILNDGTTSCRAVIFAPPAPLGRGTKECHIIFRLIPSVSVWWKAGHVFVIVT